MGDFALVSSKKVDPMQTYWGYDGQARYVTDGLRKSWSSLDLASLPVASSYQSACTLARYGRLLQLVAGPTTKLLSHSFIRSLSPLQRSNNPIADALDCALGSGLII